MHAPIELRGYAALDDQVLALLHRRQQEGRGERAGVVMNVITWQDVTDTEIYRVPANFAQPAFGGQSRCLVVAVKLRVFDDHCQSREWPGDSCWLIWISRYHGPRRHRMRAPRPDRAIAPSPRKYK